MNSRKRKGARIICCAICLVHTIAMVEMGGNLIAHLTTMTAGLMLRREAKRRHNLKQRRVQAQNNVPRRSTINENKEQRKKRFLAFFEDVFRNNPTSDDAPAASDNDKFAALILQGGKIYCRENQIKQNKLSRARYFVQMLKQGAKAARTKLAQSDYGLPILIKHDDR